MGLEMHEWEWVPHLVRKPKAPLLTFVRREHCGYDQTAVTYE
jgi:hypothetical protein